MTRREQEVLAFIETYLRNNDGVSPSLDEIGRGTGRKAKSGVHRILLQLERSGFIRRFANRSRSIEIVRSPTIGDIAMRERVWFAKTVSETVSLPRTCEHCGAKLMHYGSCNCPNATLDWVDAQRQDLKRKSAELDKIEKEALRRKLVEVGYLPRHHSCRRRSA